MALQANSALRSQVEQSADGAYPYLHLAALVLLTPSKLVQVHSHLFLSNVPLAGHPISFLV